MYQVASYLCGPDFMNFVTKFEFLQCLINTAVDCYTRALSVDNGQVVTSGSALNSTAIYSCNTGYTLTGSATRVCGSSGLWTPDAPNCICKSFVFAVITVGASIISLCFA